MLQDNPFHCPKEYQKEMLEKEGLTVIPGGAYNKSLKVENYRDYLFNFDTLTNTDAIERKTGVSNESY